MSYPGGYALRPRTIRVLAALAISSLTIALPGAPLAAAGPYVEPVFGLLVEPGKAAYLPAAPDIAKRCSLAGAKYLVFAHIKDKAGDAYVLQDADSAQSVAARVTPAGCTTSDVPWMLSGTRQGTPAAAGDPPALPGDKAEKVCQSGTCHYVLRSTAEEQMLKALIDDAVVKAQAANGGPAGFKAKACLPAVMRNAEDYPAVRSRLGSLCGM